jgi:hypothetical protein
VIILFLFYLLHLPLIAGFGLFQHCLNKDVISFKSQTQLSNDVRIKGLTELILLDSQAVLLNNPSYPHWQVNVYELKKYRDVFRQDQNHQDKDHKHP